MYKEIRENDRDWDEELAGARYIGQTMGCGCCSGWEELTVDRLEAHIQDLQEQLSKAQDLLNKV